MLTLKQKFWVVTVLVLSWLTTWWRFGHRRPAPGEIRGLLVFQLTELGDVALSTAVLYRLRERYPHARLIYVCGPWAKPLMEGQACVDEVFAYQSNIAMTGQKKLSLGEHWRAVREMARLPVDLIVDLRGNLGSVLAAWLSPARYRVDRGTLRWKDIQSRQKNWDRHETDLNLQIVEPLGIGYAPPRPKLTAMPDIDQSLETILLKGGFKPGIPFVVLHPGGGSNWVAKRWPEDRFAAIGDRIVGECGMQVVLTGSKAEQELGQRISKCMGTPPVDMIGRINLRELMGLYARAKLIISNDTGPMHIATALGCQVIVLWGPTNLAKFGPRYSNVRTLVGQGSVPSGDQTGSKINLIQVAEVWEEVKKKLNQEICYANA